MKIQGYHGTTRDTAEKLASGEFSFKDSTNEGDWLGRGVYFFQDAPGRAARWARLITPGHPIGVVQAEIELTDCLDLLDHWWFDALRATYGAFSRTGAASSQEELFVQAGQARLPSTGKLFANFRDRDFIDYYVERSAVMGGPEFNSVRSPFLWGFGLFRESFVFSRSHIQIAVRNPSMISNPKLTLVS